MLPKPGRNDNKYPSGVVDGQGTALSLCSAEPSTEYTCKPLVQKLSRIQKAEDQLTGTPPFQAAAPLQLHRAHAQKGS